MCDVTQELESTVVDLHTQLAAAEASLAELRHASDASKLLERANRELDQLRGRLRVSAHL